MSNKLLANEELRAAIGEAMEPKLKNIQVSKTHDISTDCQYFCLDLAFEDSSCYGTMIKGSDTKRSVAKWLRGLADALEDAARKAA